MLVKMDIWIRVLVDGWASHTKGMDFVMFYELSELFKELISRVESNASKNLDHSKPTYYSLLSQTITLSSLGCS